MDAPDSELQVHVIKMNHTNSLYKEASKHVKFHATPPKPKAKAGAKGQAKAKAEPKAAAGA